VTTLASKTFTVSANQWYNVTFSVIGSSLKLYVNDTLQLSATDTKFTAGQIGVGTYYSTAEFDDIVVQ
jgi:pectate lyase